MTTKERREFKLLQARVNLTGVSSLSPADRVRYWYLEQCYSFSKGK